MKIVSWNVENVARCLSYLPAVVEALNGPDVLCLQELRVRACDADALNALSTAVPGYGCHFSLPRDDRNVTFRGGRMYGVATFVKGRWRAEVLEWDREGRVVAVRRGRLAVVNLYAVNGTSKPWLDESGRAAGTRHEFKRRFQARLLDLGRALREEGSVVLIGDWNVTPTAQGYAIRGCDRRTACLGAGRPRRAHRRRRLRRHLAGASSFGACLHLVQPPARAGLDAARVDYALVSDDLTAKIRAAEIHGLLPWSDHAPISVEW
jgi:exodeoxyribonuclease-3